MKKSITKIEKYRIIASRRRGGADGNSGVSSAKQANAKFSVIRKN